MDAPDDLAGYRRDLKRALALLTELEPGYIKGREYYEGTRNEVSASKTVRALIEQSGEAAPISLAHIPVDVIANKVELSGITATEAPAAKLLEQVADANDLDDEGDDWITKACYFGDYYAIIDPAEEDNDGKITPESLRIVGSSPLSTIVVYDRKDGRTPLYGVKRWQGEGKQWHALMFYDDGTVPLSTATGIESELKADHFELDVDDDGEEIGVIPHPGGKLLVKHLPVDGKPYGKPVHRHAFGPQDAITKISATNLVNVDGQGFASRWALADPLAEIDDDMDADFGDDGPDTEPGDSDGMTGATTDKSRVRSIPGAIALLRGIKAVGQFDATSSDDFLKNLDWYVRVMAVASGIPLFEFDLKGEQPSGESRRRAEGRSNKHARKVQRAASAFFRDLGDTVLAVLGTSGTVSATFSPLETSTDKDGLELVGLKIANGVPVKQALLEAGYTPEQLDEWYKDGEPHVTPAMLTILAAALASLGNAKTLGVITDAELADMLPTILTGARGEGPAIDDDESGDELITNSSEAIKAQAEALGTLVRAGADPEQAAAAVGLDGIDFPNVPVTVRVPDVDAAVLEGSAKAPKAPAAPKPPVVEPELEPVT